MIGPSGATWLTRTIAELTKTSAGGTPKKSGKEFYEGGNIPWILSGEVASRDIVEAKNFITPAGLRGSSAKLFPPGSVLVAMYGATAGEVGILRIEAATNQAVCAILPGEEHIPEYVYYYFLYAKQELVARAVGNAQPNISQAKIKSTRLPVPQMEEQKRIVAVLDQAFAALDRARAHAEANLTDANNIFDGWLTAVFHDHPSSWRTEKLRNLCHQITVGHVGSMAERYVESGIPFLRSQNIRAFEIALGDVKFIDDGFHRELRKSTLGPGDVAIVRTGYPGTAAVIPQGLPVANCSDLVIARPKNVISPEFLVMFLNSSFGKSMVAEKAVGAAQKHFNVGAAKEVDFSFPPIAEQERLVAQAKWMRSRMGQLESIYEMKLADIGNLRQSLLHKAFSGELT